MNRALPEFPGWLRVGSRCAPALVLTVILTACPEPEAATLPGTTCAEAFSEVPVIGNLETLDQFEEAMSEVDLTIAACESIDTWTAAAVDRFDVEVTDPASFIYRRCVGVPTPVEPVQPAGTDASPPIDASRVLVMDETPLCIEASEAVGEP